MPTTIEEPFELDVGNPTNANFFWADTRGPIWDSGSYRFEKVNTPAMPSGEGLSTWKVNVPRNMASPAAWNVVLHHRSARGAGGAVLIRAEAQVLASGDTPSAMTTIVPNVLLGVGNSGDTNISVLSSTNFDSLLTLVAGNDLHLRLKRMPLNSSGDSLTAGWDLIMSPILRIDVT